MKNEIKKAYDYLRFGKYGDYVEGNGIRIIRVADYIDTMPFVVIEINGKFIEKVWEPDKVIEWLEKADA